MAGHRLGKDDLRVTYTFDSGSSGTPSNYEAHSDNNVSQGPETLSVDKESYFSILIFWLFRSNTE